MLLLLREAKDKAIYEVLDSINKEINGPSANDRYFASLQDRGNYSSLGLDGFRVKFIKPVLYNKDYVRHLIKSIINLL